MNQPLNLQYVINLLTECGRRFGNHLQGGLSENTASTLMIRCWKVLELISDNGIAISNGMRFEPIPEIIADDSDRRKEIWRHLEKPQYIHMCPGCGRNADGGDIIEVWEKEIKIAIVHVECLQDLIFLPCHKLVCEIQPKYLIEEN